MTNLIKQVVLGDGYTQSIKMIVRDNERGPQGDQGEAGEAATIRVGNVYTTNPGTSAAIMNTGTDNDAVFDFYIPKGEKGERGTDGQDGQDGAVHYTAGPGIIITNDNIIEATGSAVATWGDIVGTLSNQTDLKNALDSKQGNLTAGANIQINSGTISATDTTYNNFTGTNGTVAGSSGLVPAPAITDTNKFLKSDGSWSIATTTTVYNGVLTIKQNGTNVATFSANSAANITADIISPVITMTTTDPGDGSSLSGNNFVGVYGGDPIVLDYSSNEVNTGTKWIDGSTIYKKTVNIGTLPNNTEASIPHGISNIDMVVKLEGFAKNTTTNNQIPLPFVSSSLNNQIYLSTTPTNITVGCGIDRSALSGYVTLYYTKSS